MGRGLIYEAFTSGGQQQGLCEPRTQAPCMEEGISLGTRLGLCEVQLCVKCRQKEFHQSPTLVTIWRFLEVQEKGQL